MKGAFFKSNTTAKNLLKIKCFDFYVLNSARVRFVWICNSSERVLDHGISSWNVPSNFCSHENLRKALDLIWRALMSLLVILLCHIIRKMIHFWQSFGGWMIPFFLKVSGNVLSVGLNEALSLVETSFKKACSSSSSHCDEKWCKA